jgi:hypothetical protein
MTISDDPWARSAGPAPFCCRLAPFETSSARRRLLAAALVMLGTVPAGLARAQDNDLGSCPPGFHLEGGRLVGPPPGMLIGGHCVRNFTS